MTRVLAIIAAMILGYSLVGCIPTGQQETPPVAALPRGTL